MTVIIRIVVRSLALFLVVGASPYLHSSDDLIPHVREALGKIAYLRVPDGKSELRFNSSGAPVGSTDPCAWTVCSALVPREVTTAGNSIVISGNRAVAIYDRDSRSLVPLPIGRSFTLSIDLPPTADVTRVIETLAKIFDSGGMDQKLRDYWRPNDAGSEPCISGWISDRPAYMFDCAVLQRPKPTYTPDPEYPDLAHRKGITGEDTISVVVNEQGQPDVIEIAKKAGAGMDISAVEAISQWRFKPALRNGEPVACSIPIGVGFELFREAH